MRYIGFIKNVVSADVAVKNHFIDGNLTAKTNIEQCIIKRFCFVSYYFILAKKSGYFQRGKTILEPIVVFELGSENIIPLIGWNKR